MKTKTLFIYLILFIHIFSCTKNPICECGAAPNSISGYFDYIKDKNSLKIYVQDFTQNKYIELTKENYKHLAIPTIGSYDFFWYERFAKDTFFFLPGQHTNPYIDKTISNGTISYNIDSLSENILASKEEYNQKKQLFHILLPNIIQQYYTSSPGFGLESKYYKVLDQNYPLETISTDSIRGETLKYQVNNGYNKLMSFYIEKDNIKDTLNVLIVGNGNAYYNDITATLIFKNKKFYDYLKITRLYYARYNPSYLSIVGGPL